MSDPEKVNQPDDLYAIGDGNPLLVFFDRMERLPDVIARRQRSYELLGLRPGARVADVGCGAGTVVRDLAARVGPGGSSVGVDVNELLIQTATARAARAGVEVTFHVASAESLPFPPASLDGYRAERLYQHLPDPRKALAEAHRVLAPGGRIVLVDQDWDATLLDSEDLATTRAVLRRFADGVVNSAVGRQYHRLLNDAGFTDVKVEAEAFTTTSFEQYGFFPELFAQVAELSGALPPAAAQAWLADQRARGERGRFFLAMTHFLASARR